MDGMVQAGSWCGGVARAGGRRRRWSAADKAAIVAESFASGAKVLEVAKRHGVRANMLSTWRGQALAQGNATVGGPASGPISAAPPFVPVRCVAGFGRQTDALADEQPKAGAIEIVLADASIRVAKGVDTATLSRVLAAVRGGQR